MLKEQAYSGAGWAKDALSLQPCEIWEQVKGRTIWFAGDSISQVSIISNHTIKSVSSLRFHRTDKSFLSHAHASQKALPDGNCLMIARLGDAKSQKVFISV